MAAGSVQAIKAGLARLAAGLWLIAFALFLITLSGSLAVNQPRLYNYGFDHFRVSEDTGIATEDLRRTARELIHYFNNGEELFQVRVAIRGQGRDLFTQREVIHLKDVKDLVHKVYWTAGLSLAYLSGYVAMRLARRRRRSELVSIMRLALYGSLLTLGLLLVLGLWALVGFGGLFYLFHVLSFSNPFWILDPSQHYLIQLFPEGFFFQATLLIAAATAGEAIAVGSLAAWGLSRTRRPRTP